MKKGVISLSWVIAIIIITITGLILISSLLFPDSGMFSKVTKAATDFADKVFGGIQTGEDFDKPKTGIPEDVRDGVNALYYAFLERLPSDCLLTHKKFPDDFKGYTVRLIQKGNNIDFFMITSKGQIIDMLLEVPDKKLCVVAGDKINGVLPSWVFYDKYLEPKPQGLTGATYIEVNQIEIKEDKIKFDGVEAKYKNLGMLFSTDEAHACFFPAGGPITQAFTSGGGSALGVNGVQLNKVYDGTSRLGGCSEDAATKAARLAAEKLAAEKQAVVDNKAECDLKKNGCTAYTLPATCDMSTVAGCDDMKCFWEDKYNCLLCDSRNKDPGCRKYYKELSCEKNACNYNFDCYWDGFCEMCPTTDDCKMYSKDTCTSNSNNNPCNFQTTCIWGLKGLNECVDCKTIKGVSEYTESDCTVDPCNLGKKTEWKRAHWYSFTKSCVEV